MLPVAVKAYDRIVPKARRVPEAGAHRATYAHPIGKMQPAYLETLQNRRGAVARAVIDHEQVEIPRAVAQLRDDGLQASRLVVCRNQTKDACRSSRRPARPWLTHEIRPGGSRTCQ